MGYYLVIYCIETDKNVLTFDYIEFFNIQIEIRRQLLLQAYYIYVTVFSNQCLM